jgi:EmrB/QacA subfamily drug resistance transporter
MVFVDTSILNVAFRSLVADFGPQHQRQLTWIFSGYSIAFAAALLTAGRAGDRFGRKRAYLTGVALFALSSAACAIAPGPGLLILARISQALGGALVVPAALALVLPEFPPEKRSVAIGISGAIGGLSAAFGPTLGGVLVEAFGWRSVFTINLPISVIALVMGQRILRESKDSSAVRLPDPLGGLLAMAGFGLLTAAIVEGDDWGWSSLRVVGAVVAAAAALALFVHRSRTHPVPVVDLALFKLRFFTAANLSSFLFSMGFFGMFFTNVAFLQAVWHYSPIRSGLASAPGPMMAAIFAGPAGSWATQRGHKKVIVPGLVLFALGIAVILATATADGSYFTTFLPAYLLTGIGVGLTISTLGSASNAFLPPNRFGMGSAVNATGRQVGAAMGIAVVSALRSAAGGGDPLVGFRRSWMFIIVTAALAGVAMMTLFQPPSADDLAASRIVPAPAG